MLTATTLSRFTERRVTRGRVDREAGIIYGVKVLGRHSQNEREYTERAMQSAVPLYDGARVYVNHPAPDKLDHDRSFHDWVGVLRNPRFESSGIFADIVLRQKSPLFEEVIEAAEKFNGRLGMSHVANGESHYDQSGREIVEEITSVFSVDLVMNPATANGMFESKGYAEPIQREIDQLADDARKLASSGVKWVNAVFNAGPYAKTPQSSTLQSQLARIDQGLGAWIRRPETGMENGEQTAESAKRILDAAAEVFRDPLQPNSPENAKVVLGELVQFIEDLANREIDGHPYAVDEALRESIRWHFGKYFPSPEDESKRWASRLR